MLRFLTIGCVVVITGCKYPALPSVEDATNGGSCSTKADCQNAESPVRDTSLKGGTCVACTSSDHGACGGNIPRCENKQCVACVDDTQDCGQGSLCLSTGACASANSIIYTSSSSTKTTNCGDAGNPCSLTGALMLVMTTPGKSVIKLDDAGPYVPDTASFVVDADVTIDMRGATLHPHLGMDGPLLDVRSGRTVAILGGTIAGTSNGDGILCAGNLTVDETIITMTDRSGILTTGGCNLTAMRVNINNTSVRSSQFVPAIVDSGDSITLSRSMLAFNRGGGLEIETGTFLIVGNAFLSDGSSSSAVGGIAISTTANISNRLEFNTIARNITQDGSRSGGIDCNAGTNFTGNYNIVSNNKPNTIGTVLSQLSGSGKYAYSDINPTAIPPNFDAGHNFSSDPRLVNELSDPHLIQGSPAIGYASSSADLTRLAAKDIDGDARVARTGMGADIGADQYKP